MSQSGDLSVVHRLIGLEEQTLPKPRIFIGSSVAAKHIAEHAAEDLKHDAEPEIWTDDQFHSTSTPIENLFRILGNFQFALFVALPQDVITKGSTTIHSVRDNVLFEMGLFLGRLGRERVFLIAPQNGGTPSLNLPTDLTGIAPTVYDPSAANLQSRSASA
jgi:predicted nucleotide-binding protein